MEVYLTEIHISEVFRCKMEHLAAAEQDSCEKCCKLVRCEYCPTEVYVDAKRLDDSQGGVLIITKWQLVGCGLSPFEEHWESHLDCPRRPWRYLLDDAPGSIQATYEEQPGIKHESLLRLAEAYDYLESSLWDQRMITWRKNMGRYNL